jgi:hypothetical protein
MQQTVLWIEVQRFNERRRTTDAATSSESVPMGISAPNILYAGEAGFTAGDSTASAGTSSDELAKAAIENVTSPTPIEQMSMQGRHNLVKAGRLEESPKKWKRLKKDNITDTPQKR